MKPIVAGIIGLAWSFSAAAVAAGDRVAVVSQDDSSIAEIDLQSQNIIATTKLAKGPAGIAALAENGMLYVTYPDAGMVGVVDTEHGIALPNLPYQGEPFGIAAGLGAVYVADWSKDRITRIDPTGRRSSEVVTVGKSPAGLVLDPKGHRLYVADRENGDITVLDANTMRVLASIPSGAAPFALALAPDGRRLYVANVKSNDLAVIDTAGLERIATIPLGSMPYGVAVTADGKSVLVTNQLGNSLSVVDVGARKVVATISVGRYPEGVIAAPAGIAYVANWFSGDVSVIDLGQRREIRRLKVGDGPRGFALVSDHAKEP